MTNPNQRAKNILRGIARRPAAPPPVDVEPDPVVEPPTRARGGRHARPRSERSLVGWGVAAGLGVTLLLGGGAYLSLVALGGPGPVAVATVVPVDKAERNYIYELNVALAVTGTQLTAEEEPVAVEIARKHVAHGHLIGMRVPILTDFEQRIPRLTPEQREIARVAVEHHFLAVTGRKQ